MLKVLRKNNCYLKIVQQQNYLSGMRVKQRHFQLKKKLVRERIYYQQKGTTEVYYLEDKIPQKNVCDKRKN